MADQFETGDGSGMDPGLTAGNFAGNLIAGGIGGLVGGNSGAFSAANMELYNANKDNGQGKGGTGSELADKGKAAANAVADWFKDTYGDIPGTLSRWAGQITGHMNADAQAKAGESPLALMAQGTANGLSAVAGAGGGKPPTANPGLVLVDSAAGQTANALPGTPGYVPSNATFNSGIGEQGSQGDARTSSVSDFQNAADQPFNDSGLSAAARAWDKHAGRVGGTFDPLTGSIADKNAAASEFVNQVLNDPATTRTELSRGGG